MHRALAFTAHALAVDYRVGSVFTVLLKAGSASFKAHLSFVFRPVQVFTSASKVFLLLSHYSCHQTLTPTFMLVKLALKSTPPFL